MDKAKIFLQGHRNKQSTNTSSGMNVQLKGRRKLLSLDSLSKTLSQYDQYVAERSGCSKVRLTCQVNPICSNVLFNRITEIVKDEGSDHVAIINYGLSENNSIPTVKHQEQEIGYWSGSTLTYIQKYDNIRNDTDLPPGNLSSNPSNGTSQTGVSCASPINAIRDTQLSNNENGFVYHCGLDILNNHLIRSNTFKCICACPDNNDITPGFNTIGDIMRDAIGNIVCERLSFPIGAGVPNNLKTVALHLYEYDDILTFENAKLERLKAKYNGWVGFENTSKIKTYENFSNGTELQIERPIMYMNPMDFVDMYPGRDLYSFVPKYNEYQHRIEKNWNYCITYPYSSTTNGFENIIDKESKGLKAIYFDENTRSDNGTTQLVIYGIAKHGLTVGDLVNIYKTYEDANGVHCQKVIDNAEVTNVVDDYIFTVFNANTRISQYWVELTEDELNDNSITLYLPQFATAGEEYNGTQFTIDPSKRFVYTTLTTTVDGVTKEQNLRFYIVNNKYVNVDLVTQNISYKKVVSDLECDYYVRVFSKLPNFKFASGDTTSEYEIYRERENGEKPLVEQYKAKEYEFENHLSRLAFAKNIYSDDIGQIVFTDDIDLTNIHDNLGRPLSSLYLTVLKNNKGYKEWYGYDYGGWKADVINDHCDAIEYSHCFGPLVCGLELSEESMYMDNNSNVHQISLKNDTIWGYDISAINGERETLQTHIPIRDDEIWYDTDVNFYGDLCYYDNYNAMERVIQPMMYRFNTAQRECGDNQNVRGGSNFNSYGYDEIYYDDYDTQNDYTLTSYTVSTANEMWEGYYYQPHYEIPINSFGKLRSIMPDRLTIRQITTDGNCIYTIVCQQEHYLSPGDKAMIYDTNEKIYYICSVISGNSDTLRTFTCRLMGENGEKLNIDPHLERQGLKLFKLDNMDVPSYAHLLKDGTCRYIWRDLYPNGLNRDDETIEEYPFTNGAFYINKKIDIYVRRQDPYKVFGLSNEDKDVYIEGVTTDVSTSENYYVKEEDMIC